MPASQIKTISTTHSLGVWKITESTEELKQLYGSRPFFSNKPIRNNHWYASRLLLLDMLPKGATILNNAKGKPICDVADTEISITHSGLYAAALVCKNHFAGIDIERLDERIHRVANKFLNDIDRLSLNKAECLTETLTLIWSAKEAVYKHYGLKEVDFKAHLNILPFEFNSGNRISATITMPHLTQRIQLEYEMLDELLMVYTLD